MKVVLENLTKVFQSRHEKGKEVVAVTISPSPYPTVNWSDFSARPDAVKAPRFI